MTNDWVGQIQVSRLRRLCVGAGLVSHVALPSNGEPYGVQAHKSADSCAEMEQIHEEADLLKCLDHFTTNPT